MATNYGFRIVGDCRNERRLTDWQKAFAAYADCDYRADVDKESYLSAFTFGPAFADFLNSTGSTKGYNGDCFALWLWLDIDRENDQQAARTDAQQLCASICERYDLDGNELLIFFSGSKGFHIGLPTSLFRAEPSTGFNRFARCFAERLADSITVAIDNGVYDKVRAFRAPNSRHSRTGLHKRCLTFDELLKVKTNAIVERASEPEPFEISEPPETNQRAVDDWQGAIDQVACQLKAAKQRRANLNGSSTLNRATREFIQDGASLGDRHRLLFSAAANLAEFGCSSELAHALLAESALDAGLPPKEVKRQIECGLNYKNKQDWRDK